MNETTQPSNTSTGMAASASSLSIANLAAPSSEATKTITSVESINSTAMLLQTDVNAVDGIKDPVVAASAAAVDTASTVVAVADTSFGEGQLATPLDAGGSAVADVLNEDVVVGTETETTAANGVPDTQPLTTGEQAIDGQEYDPATLPEMGQPIS